MPKDLEHKKLVAEVRKAEADALKAEIEVEAAILRSAKDLARAENNYIYHFMGPITPESAHECINTIDNWSRLTPDKKNNHQYLFRRGRSFARPRPF